jgi:hypothetical protein
MDKNNFNNNRGGSPIQAIIALLLTIAAIIVGVYLLGVVLRVIVLIIAGGLALYLLVKIVQGIDKMK